jgi:hypothetical protein
LNSFKSPCFGLEFAAVLFLALFCLGNFISTIRTCTSLHFLSTL